MNNVVVALALACAAAAAVATVMWLRARGAAARVQARVARAEETAAESDRQAGALKKELAEARRQVSVLEPRVWLEEFPADAVYTLLASASVENDPRHFGLVRDEAGAIRPFLGQRALSPLEPGDTFTAVRGQLVKLDPSDLETPAPAPNIEDTVRLDTRDVASAATARPASAAPGADSTVFLSPERTAQPPKDPDAGLTFLEVIEGPDEGTRFALPFARAEVGRGTENEVTLSDSGASRVHCTIDYEKHRFVLRDNNSTNGTLCNDVQISEQDLNFGDVVHVADTKMRWSCEGFEQRDSDAPAAIRALEQTLQHAPDFVAALKHLAFLLEKDIARKKEAQPLWDRLAELER